MPDATKAENIVRKSRKWGNAAGLEFLIYSGKNERCCFFMAYYREKTGDALKSVPLGVDIITKKIINCIVDDD